MSWKKLGEEIWDAGRGILTIIGFVVIMGVIIFSHPEFLLYLVGATAIGVGFAALFGGK